MKVVLVALNAKYIHSSLALRYLRTYSSIYDSYINIEEYTINNSVDFIMRELYTLKPNILCFSCYIWNIGMIKEICRELKKVLPNTKIILGGPEVSYEVKSFMEENQCVDNIIFGEGEETFLQVLKCYIDGEVDINNIDGLAYRKGSSIIVNNKRSALNLNDIPFPYKNLNEFKNKIIYYETTRGCPYSCQYCLSSIEKGVRYREISKVKKELQSFLDARVMQVKFVDRTFNCSKKHSLAIWSYLIEKDNGYTNFHFEITADLLDDESIKVLKQARPGLFQFEIGVQSTNQHTINYIQRKTSFKVLSEKVKEINKCGNIHQHLDLIVGLPGEDYESFGKSFNDVYELEPEQLQLGFLKVLKGSGLYYNKSEFGLVYKDKAPYEILYTNDISYEEVLKLKMIEEMVEVFYNTRRFTNGIKYLETLFSSPFAFFEELSNYWKINGLHEINHSKLAYYDHLLSFGLSIGANLNILKPLLIFDLYYHEKAKKLLDWMQRARDNTFEKNIINFYKEKENIYNYLADYKEFTPKQISRIAHIEVFPIDILAWLNEKKVVFKKSGILFNYYNKTPIYNKAVIYDVTKYICKQNL